MTAPTEPLAMTLEEILVAIEREAYGSLTPIPARGRSTAHSWVFTDLTDQSSPQNAHDFESLSAAASFALDRPVVARDDAAELRAALQQVWLWLRREFPARPDSGEAVEESVRGIWSVVCDALATAEGES